jgi:hypothetical protein
MFLSEAIVSFSKENTRSFAAQRRKLKKREFLRRNCKIDYLINVSSKELRASTLIELYFSKVMKNIKI